MVGLRVKQAAVWFISFAIGTAITFAIVHWYLGTTVDSSWVYLYLAKGTGNFATKYFILTNIFISMVFVIWGDKLVDAGILPD